MQRRTADGHQTVPEIRTSNTLPDTFVSHDKTA